MAPTDLIEAHLQLCWSARARGDRDEEHRQAVLAMTLAEAFQDPHMLVRTLNLLAVALSDLGLRGAERALIERSIVLAREGRLLRVLAHALSNLVSSVYPDDLETGEQTSSTRPWSLRRQLGDVNAIESTLVNGVIVWWLSGEWDRVVVETDQWLDGEPTAAVRGALARSRAGRVRPRRGGDRPRAAAERRVLLRAGSRPGGRRRPGLGR